MVAKTYGGSPLIRRNSMPHVTAAPRPAPDRAPSGRPATAVVSATAVGGLGHHLERLRPGAHRPGGAGGGHRGQRSAASSTVSPTGPPQVTSTPWAASGPPPAPAPTCHTLTAAPAARARATISGRPPPIQTGIPGADNRSGHRCRAFPTDRGVLEGDAVGLVLVPAELVAGADTGDEPTAAHGVQAAQDLDQDLVGQQTDPGDQGAEGDRRGRRGQRAEQRARREGRAPGLADRPQVVEAEDAVDPQGLGPPGGGEGGVGVVPELRKGDADPSPARSSPRSADSTCAFRSRRAIDMMRLWARILMNPGRGTFISTSRW